MKTAEADCTKFYNSFPPYLLATVGQDVPIQEPQSLRCGGQNVDQEITGGQDLGETTWLSRYETCIFDTSATLSMVRNT